MLLGGCGHPEDDGHMPGLQQGICHVIFLATCLKSLLYMGFLQVLLQKVSGNFDCLLLVQKPVLILAQRFAVIPADGHSSLVFQDGSYLGGQLQAMMHVFAVGLHSTIRTGLFLAEK